jgi:hypothetical protein
MTKAFRPSSTRGLAAPILLALSCFLLAKPVRAQVRPFGPPLPALEGSVTPLASLRNSTGSVVIGDRSDGRRAYVLPPSTGWVVPQKFTPSANAIHCAEMLALQNTSRELAAKLAQLALADSAAETELEDMRMQKAALAAEQAATSHFGSVELQADELEYQSWEVEDALVALRQRCNVSFSCREAEGRAMGHLSGELSRLTNLVALLRDEAELLRSRHAAATRALASVTSAIAAREDAALLAMAQLIALQEQTFSMYAHYAALLGGTAALSFDAGWEESVRSLTAENPAIRFERVATANAQVQAGLVPGIGEDSYLASLPSVLSYRVAGEAGREDMVLSRAAYPDKLALEMDLSLTGACALRDIQQLDLESVFGLPVFGVSVSYEYAVTFPATVQVTYNGMKVLEAIGGKPGRRTLLLTPSPIEAARPQVAIRWIGQPPQGAERKRYEDQLVSEAIDRVLRVAGQLGYDWDGFDVWRPRLTESGVLLPRVSSTTALSSMTQAPSARVQSASIRGAASPPPSRASQARLPVRPASPRSRA